MNTNIKFRASEAGKLMTEPKLKSDKEAGNLSQTTKTFIKELFLKNEYGFEEPVMTDEMMKGLLCEQDSLALVQAVLKGEFRLKNDKNFTNEYFTGTPDIILQKEDFIEDVKTSWNIKTFFNAGDPESDEERKISKMYYYQALVYMALCQKKNYRLVYCLVNTPDELVQEQIKRFYFKFGCDEQNPNYQKASEQIMRNHNFDDIPLEKRIKIFTFPFDNNEYLRMIEQAIKARQYYSTLHL